MPSKRGTTTRASGTAKRGRSSARGRGRGGSVHGKRLSDITEESVSQVQTPHTPEKFVSQERGSKKRAFQDFASDQEASPHAKRETRAQSAKRAKFDVKPAVTASFLGAAARNEDHSSDVSKERVESEPAMDTSGAPTNYTPSLNLLFFIHLASLDTDTDTESITLNLIDLTLADDNWHIGLSGLVQPVACFLIASLLTRKQNLVEDVAASVEMFGLEYQQLVEGYRLLWEWRENMAGVVGAYADRLTELPEPKLLLGRVDQVAHEVEISEIGQEMDGRPEPERWVETTEA